MYAVRDRVDLSAYPDFVEEAINPSVFPVEYFLPTSEDLEKIQANMAVLALRLLTSHLHAFVPLAPYTVLHIKHSHWNDMCKESEVVSLFS